MSDYISLTFEDAEFTRALRDYQEAQSMELSDILNKKGIDLGFQAAAQLASAIDPSRFYGQGSPLFHALAAGGKSRKNGKSLMTRFGKAVKGQGNKKLADKIYNSRKRSGGYARAMCLTMADHLGANIRLKANFKKNMSHVSATKAEPGIKPIVTMTINKAQEGMIYEVIQPAINAAMRVVAADMDKYSIPRLAKAAKRHSGRKR